METLNPQHIARLHDHLIRHGADPTLLTELLDHLICETEYYLFIGLPVESAIDKVLLEADADVVRNLRRTYQRELSLSGSQLEQATKDDIVFQFRNKAYGAYDLRQAYPHTLRDALILALGLCLMGMALLQMIGQGTFSYFSLWGAIWLSGLICVAFVGFNWYLQRERQRQSTTL